MRFFIGFRSIIEAPFITYSDIQIGSLVKVKDSLFLFEYYQMRSLGFN